MLRLSYPSIDAARSQQVLLAFGSKLPPSAVPSTMVVDERGRLAVRIIGKTSHGTLSALIQDLVGEGEQPWSWVRGGPCRARVSWSCLARWSWRW